MVVTIILVLLLDLLLATELVSNFSDLFDLELELLCNLIVFICDCHILLFLHPKELVSNNFELIDDLFQLFALVKIFDLEGFLFDIF